MLFQLTPLIGGLHGTSPFRVLHWIFRDNPTVGIILVAGIVLYSIYRYMNRR